MKPSILTLALFACGSLAFPSDELEVRQQLNHWAPAGAGEVRAPCPMLNTLANYGFLNHNGKNITQDQIVTILGNVLNVNASLAEFMFQNALTTNPNPNATTIDLDFLSRHNILEHDASLSRQDYFFGDNHDFNQTIFGQTSTHFKRTGIDITAAAAARAARIADSQAHNPTFSLSALGAQAGLGESAFYLLIFAQGANPAAGVGDPDLITYFFQNEKLPISLGWVRPTREITLDMLLNFASAIANATSSGTPSGKRNAIGSGTGFHGL